MMSEIKDDIYNLVEPHILQKGFDLVDVEIKSHKKSNCIRVLVDRPQGGILVDECVAFNKVLGEMLEEQDIFGGNYILEVCSPGLDRPLATLKDFNRAQERKVVFYLKELVDGKKEHSGIVKGVKDDSVYIECKEKEIVIPIGMINKAKYIL